MYDKFCISVEACEVCIKEYIKRETDKLKDLPNDQHKTELMHRIIHAANKAATKSCARYPCRDQMYDNFAFHNICEEHLYRMIDTIREFEEDPWAKNT